MNQRSDVSHEGALGKPDEPKSRRSFLIDLVVIAAVVLLVTQTPYGKHIQAWLQRGILWTGILPPDIALSEDDMVPANYSIPLVALDGEPVSLDRFRGRVIFINVWATWCAPCLAEMPFIQKLYEEVGDHEIEFVMISADDTRELARAFIEDREFTFPVYHLVGSMPRPYTSTQIPTTYIISAEGDVVAVNSGMANYNSSRFKRFLMDLAKDVKQEL